MKWKKMIRRRERKRGADWSSRERGGQEQQRKEKRKGGEREGDKGGPEVNEMLARVAVGAAVDSRPRLYCSRSITHSLPVQITQRYPSQIHASPSFSYPLAPIRPLTIPTTGDRLPMI